MAKHNGVEIDLEDELLLPYTYLMKFRGKQIRKQIVNAFNHWLQVPQEKLHSILQTTYMVHVGTLLIDDIQDDTRVRRGVPAAHCVYGLPLTINAGMHIFFLAFEKMFEMSSMGANIFSTEMLEVIRGQGADVYWREKALCPTESQYKHIAERKTGKMFALPVQIMQLFSENKTDYSNLAVQLGCYFQIRDDYCNLMKQEALEEWLKKDNNEVRNRNETFCEDITEGKFSFPVIHAMQFPEGQEILNKDILRQRTRDVNLKKHCISLLEKTGSLLYTRDTLAEFDRKLRDEVARLGGNPELEAVLDELLDWQM